MSLEIGEYVEAIDELRAYLSAEAGDATVRYDLASALLHVGRDPEAQAEFTKVLELDPRNRDALMGLGNAYLHLGKLDEAVATYQEASREDPMDPHPYFSLGVLYEDYKYDSESAVAAYRKYLELGGKESLRVERWIQKLTGEKP